MDPFVLCSHVPVPRAGNRILDIGCGCGVMPAVLGFCYPETFITGIEIQKSLAKLAQKNIITNRLENCVTIINSDIKILDSRSAGGLFDFVISNPPYKKNNTGRLNPDHSKAIARHEILLDINTLACKSAELLKHEGRLIIIFPFERLSDLEHAVLSYNIFPEWIRFVHTSKKENPKRIIFCGQKNRSGSCRFLQPIFLNTGDAYPLHIKPACINP